MARSDDCRRLRWDAGRQRSFVLRTVALLIALTGVVASSPARAQDSVAEAQRAADRAGAEARRAREKLERLRAAQAGSAEPGPIETSAEAARADENASRAGERRREGVRVPPESEQTRAATARAEAAAQEAERAAAEARALAERMEAVIEAHARRYARPGFLVGIAGSYLIEDLDTRLDVDDSRGLAAFLGYRFHPNVSVEVRGELIEGFDVTASDEADGLFDAELDGFLVTAGPKVYPFTGSLQPFVGLGVGAMHASLEGRDRNGGRLDRSDTDAVVRLAGGLDYYLSENLVLNLEAAYVAPGGDLSSVDFAVMSGGLTLRF